MSAVSFGTLSAGAGKQVALAGRSPCVASTMAGLAHTAAVHLLAATCSRCSRARRLWTGGCLSERSMSTVRCKSVVGSGASRRGSGGARRAHLLLEEVCERGALRQMLRAGHASGTGDGVKLHPLALFDQLVRRHLSSAHRTSFTSVRSRLLHSVRHVAENGPCLSRISLERLANRLASLRSLSDIAPGSARMGGSMRGHMSVCTSKHSAEACAAEARAVA